MKKARRKTSVAPAPTQAGKAQQRVRQLEERVAQQEVALRELTEEIELLCTSVSHDLRAPLRVIRGFADILLHDLAPKLEPEERDNLQRIVNNSERLDRLLQDLLAYSRMARVELKLAPVDLQELIGDVVSVQRNAKRERPGRITLEGPALHLSSASAGLLNQVLGILVDNAFKFAAPEIPPAIVVRTELREDKVRIWVEDNGIGINPANHERIFRVFERLGSSRAEGTGMGLALAKRAMIRMGGRIGVESGENQGSRFWIELAVTEKIPDA